MSLSEIEALQSALAGEHAAVYVLGVLGGQTSASEQPALFRAVNDAFWHHRARRDQLSSMLADRLEGSPERPMAPSPAYSVPEDLSTPEAVTATAREVEAACTTTYAAMVGATAGETRRWAVTALTDVAVRGLSFGAAPAHFPGLA